MAKKVKIKGTNFNDNLVGVQLTSGSSLLTLGNFGLTTTFDGPKTNKNYSLGTFSKPITLDTLGVTPIENKEILATNFSIFLNLDTSDPQDFVQFGSLYERLRVAVEQILTKWPAALYSTPNSVTPINVINISYNSVSNSTYFDLPTGAIINNYDMTYTTGATAAEVFAVEKNYKNIDAYYDKYNLLLNGTEYEITAFVGTIDLFTGNIGVTVKGDPFGGASTASQSLHLKRKNDYVSEFFTALDEFESELLNRNVTPIYTATFKEAVETSEGLTVFVNRNFTWPVSDGYNIDNNTPQYAEYFESLLRLGADYDDYKTDLVARFFVADSIEKYDTDDERVKKMLRIYGREFDQTKQFIDGLAFAHNVSYDKKNNIADVLIKNLARMLGWDTLNTTSAQGLLESFVSPTTAVYSGQSKGYSFAEMDIELWRRLILNTAYLFRAKGTRKVIEFMFRFIGAPDCLVDFNEHVYLADAKIDVTNFKKFVSLTSGIDVGDIDLDDYAIDDDGYPDIIPDNPDLYFQAQGGWYRETDVQTGNNPHYGPYDHGQTYIDQMYRCFYTGETIFKSVVSDAAILSPPPGEWFPAGCTFPNCDGFSYLKATLMTFSYSHDQGTTWGIYDQTVQSFSEGVWAIANAQFTGGSTTIINIATGHNATIMSASTDLRLYNFYQNYPQYPLPIPKPPCYGFGVSPLIEDNKKSWVYTGSPANRVYDLNLRETNYFKTSGYIEQESKLVINTKEIVLNYNPAKAIECDVYDYIKLYGCPISLTGMTKPYPSKYWFGEQGGPDWSGGMDVSSMTFVEFIGEVYRKFINVRNRKVIDDAHGGGYPTLRMIYQDYLDGLTKCGHTSNAYKYAQLIDFVDVMQEYWLGLIEQVFPATVIWETGIAYRNTVFDRQKFVYKHGINDGSEFQLELENPQSDPSGALEPITVIGSVSTGINASVTFLETDGCYGEAVISGTEECIKNYVIVSPAAARYGNVVFTDKIVVSSRNVGNKGMTGLDVNSSGQVVVYNVSVNLA